jgi:tetratricopeptide (TPR) repeat protein
MGMPLRINDGGRDKKHIEELLQEARRAFLASDTTRARELFEKVSQIEKDHPEVLHGFGVIALRQGRYKEAIAFLQQAVEKNPHFAEAWNNLGFALFKKGKHQEAKKAFEKAVELDPGETSYRENLRALGGNGQKVKGPLLSLCMIVRDEAQNLREHLAKIAEFFDDLVVVDTGSSDETKAVAASLGARVFSVPWENDFSKARNESLRRAWGEWILVLDADEVVDEEGVRRLREIAQKTEALGLQLPIYNYNRNGNVGVVNFALRFFRRHPGIRFAGKIHETAEASIVALGGAIGRTDVPIHHFGYTRPEDVRRKSVERNFPIIEELYRSEPDNIQAVLYYAKTRLTMFGDREEAQKALFQIVRNPAWRGKPAYIEGLFYLGTIFADRGEFHIAERIFERVRRYDPYLPDALFALGNLAFLREDYSKALALLEEIFHLEAGRSQANLVRFAFTDEILYELLLRSAIACGAWEKALSYGEKLRALLPEDPNALHNLALVYFNLHRWEEAEALWREVLVKDPQHPEARSLLFYLYTLAGRADEAQRVLQEVEAVF